MFHAVGILILFSCSPETRAKAAIDPVDEILTHYKLRAKSQKISHTHDPLQNVYLKSNSNDEDV